MSKATMDPAGETSVSTMRTPRRKMDPPCLSERRRGEREMAEVVASVLSIHCGDSQVGQYSASSARPLVAKALQWRFALPESSKIYHVTHLDNLREIVGDALLSDAERIRRQLNCKIVGMSEIMTPGLDRRNRRPPQPRGVPVI